MISNKLIGLAAVAFLAGSMGFTAVGCSSDSTADDEGDDDAGSSSSGGSSSGRPPIEAGTSSSGGEPEACYAAEGPLAYSLNAAPGGQNVCTPAQTQAALTACALTGATEATCEAFSTANPECMKCVFGAQDSTAMPAIINITLAEEGYSIPNVNNCYAAVVGVPGEQPTAESDENSCGWYLSNIQTCVFANCETCEDGAEDQSPLHDACRQEAAEDEAGCKLIVDGASCFEAAATAAGVTQAQLDQLCQGTGFEDTANKVINVLCGAPLGDGGTTGDAGSDAAD